MAKSVIQDDQTHLCGKRISKNKSSYSQRTPVPDPVHTKHHKHHALHTKHQILHAEHMNCMRRSPLIRNQNTVIVQVRSCQISDKYLVRENWLMNRFKIVYVISFACKLFPKQVWFRYMCLYVSFVGSYYDQMTSSDRRLV